MNEIKQDALAICHAALATEIGVAVACPDPESAMGLFQYTIGTDPALSALCVRRSRSNPMTEIWLIQQSALREPQ